MKANTEWLMLRRGLGTGACQVGSRQGAYSWAHSHVAQPHVLRGAEKRKKMMTQN